MGGSAACATGDPHGNDQALGKQRYTCFTGCKRVMLCAWVWGERGDAGQEDTPSAQAVPRALWWCIPNFSLCEPLTYGSASVAAEVPLGNAGALFDQSVLLKTGGTCKRYAWRGKEEECL